MTKHSDAERARIMAQARELVAWGKSIECDRIARQVQAEAFEDPPVKWKRAADERAKQKRQADFELKMQERRDRRERIESAAVTELRAEIAALRSAINQGDAATLDTICEAVMPALEQLADKFQAAITKISQRVDDRLAEMQREVHGAVKRERAGEVIDMPSLRELRKIN